MSYLLSLFYDPFFFFFFIINQSGTLKKKKKNQNGGCLLLAVYILLNSNCMRERDREREREQIHHKTPPPPFSPFSLSLVSKLGLLHIPTRCTFLHFIFNTNISQIYLFILCSKQKTTAEGKDYCERKINLLRSNFDQLVEVCSEYKCDNHFLIEHSSFHLNLV